MGGRRGQAEVDQELRKKEVGSAFEDGTNPQGAFNRKAIAWQRRNQESLIRAGNQARASQDESLKTKDGGTRRGVSIEAATGGT